LPPYYLGDLHTASGVIVYFNYSFKFRNLKMEPNSKLTFTFNDYITKNTTGYFGLITSHFYFVQVRLIASSCCARCTDMSMLHGK